MFQKLRELALQRNPDKMYWSMGRLSASIVGNHEILKENCRWGVVDPSLTLTHAYQCSFVDALKQNALLDLKYDEVVGKEANIFVSFAYGDNFIDLVDALERYLMTLDERERDKACFWYDMLVNDQWHALDKDFDWWATTFRTAVQHIGETLIFLSSWSDPAMIKRAWCLYEISCSKKLSIAICRDQEANFIDTLRYNHSSIIASLSKIDLENATAYLDADKENIFEAVRSIEGGFHGFNVTVVGLLRDWVIQRARDVSSELIEVDALSEKELVDLGQSSILLTEQGKFEEAKEILEQICSAPGFAKFGFGYHNLLTAVQNLASILKSQGKFEEAKVLIERALTAREGSEIFLGPKDPCKLGALNLLGCILEDLGKLEEAKEVFEQALAGKEEVLGAEDRDTLATVANLASLYSRLGQFEQAIVMLKHVRDIEERTLGPKHPDTLTTVNNLGGLYHTQGRFEEAKVFFERALTGKEKTLGPEHPSTLKTLGNLGLLLKDQGKLDEAKVFYRRALAGKEKSLGFNHPSTLITRRGLNSVLELEAAKGAAGSSSSSSCLCCSCSCSLSSSPPSCLALAKQPSAMNIRGRKTLPSCINHQIIVIIIIFISCLLLSLILILSHLPIFFVNQHVLQCLP